MKKFMLLFLVCTVCIVCYPYISLFCAAVLVNTQHEIERLMAEDEEQMRRRAGKITAVEGASKFGFAEEKYTRSAGVYW